MHAHNTVEELIEACLSSRRIGLSHMEHERAVLRKINRQIEPVPTKVALSEDWKRTIRTKHLPRNMMRGKTDKRHIAQAKAMAQKLEENARVLYAHASLRKLCECAAVVVSSIDRLIVSAFLRTKDPAIAEEVAVAIALIQPTV